MVVGQDKRCGVCQKGRLEDVTDMDKGLVKRATTDFVESDELVLGGQAEDDEDFDGFLTEDGGEEMGHITGRREGGLSGCLTWEVSAGAIGYFYFSDIQLVLPSRWVGYEAHPYFCVILQTRTKGLQRTVVLQTAYQFRMSGKETDGGSTRAKPSPFLAS